MFATGTSVFQISGEVIPKLFIWDAESDSVSFYNTHTAQTDQMEYDVAKDSKQYVKVSSILKVDILLFLCLRSKNRHFIDTNDSVPVLHCWDSRDPRLLACQASNKSGQNHVISFFMTSEHGLLIQDTFRPTALSENLLGVEIPYFYFTKKVVPLAVSNLSVNLLL